MVYYCVYLQSIYFSCGFISLFYYLYFRSFVHGRMFVINFSSSLCLSLPCISFFLPNVLLMWFASVVYSFLLSFRSCALLVLVGVGYIYACIAGMIITDEVTAKRFESWKFS